MHTEVSVPEARPVVVGVDGSRTGPGIVGLAAGEAARRGAEMLIVHVWPGRYTGSFRSRATVPVRADAERLLEVSAHRARQAAPGLLIRTAMLDGAAARTLARCSERAGLLVVGHRDEAATRSSWGSTAAYLAQHSSCPLLVNRGAAARRGPVVLAASGHPSGQATAGYAFAEAAILGSRLVAMHMWSLPDSPEEFSPLVVAGGYAAERTVAEHTLARVLDAWSERFPEVPVERLVVRDPDIGYTLERASRRGCLLVAGTGRSGHFAELLYGSRGPGTLHRTTCPVVLVPKGWPVDGNAPADAGRPTSGSAVEARRRPATPGTLGRSPG